MQIKINLRSMAVIITIVLVVGKYAFGLNITWLGAFLPLLLVVGQLVFVATILGIYLLCLLIKQKL